MHQTPLSCHWIPVPGSQRPLTNSQPCINDTKPSSRISPIQQYPHSKIYLEAHCSESPLLQPDVPRMVGEGTLKFQPRTMGWDTSHCSRLLQTLSSLALDTSRDGTKDWGAWETSQEVSDVRKHPGSPLSAGMLTHLSRKLFIPDVLDLGLGLV